MNTYLPQEQDQVLLSEKKHWVLTDDIPNIFKKSSIDRYMERPIATFCNGKYIILKYFCSAGFLVYYTLENISNKTCEYQLDELDDNLI